MTRPVVAYQQDGLRYPERAPYDPPEAYPEYPFGATALDSGNAVYDAVRTVLRDCGLDAGNYGTPRWNPLGDLVAPGGTVVLKPNWVRHFHPRKLDVFSIITHPSVLRPLIDYAYKAVGDTGEIRLMDAPLYDTDFAVLAELCGLAELEQTLRARGVPLVVGDLRFLTVEIEHGVVVRRRHREVWESEGIVFDLGNDSALAELGPHLRRLYGSDYDRRLTTSLHRRRNGVQEHRYRIARRVIEADLLISVPKLKTHKKTGVTLNVKNMIGINTDKNYIPHFRIGAPNQGGDEYPDSSRRAERARRAAVASARDLVVGRMGSVGERLGHGFVRALLAVSEGRMQRRAPEQLDAMDVFYRATQGGTYRSGDWWGNDTCWRSAVDINRIMLYGRPDGTLAEQPARRFFSVIDGIVGGEGTGPLMPDPRHDGVLVAGFDPVSVDIVATRIMGFDPALIRDQRHAGEPSRYPLRPEGTTVVTSNRPEWDGEIAPGSDLGFAPHSAWHEYLGGDRARVGEPQPVREPAA